MAEKDTIFSSKIKYGGLFSFKDFYQFCYDWITEETGLDVAETKYEEKIAGDSKEITVEWECEKKLTDYFKFLMKVNFKIGGLTNVEVVQDGVKLKMNKGTATVSVKGILVRDYDSKFEGTPMKKFMRAVYEKWIITSRVKQFEDKIAGDCDEFLGQAKAYLDLEGRK